MPKRQAGWLGRTGKREASETYGLAHMAIEGHGKARLGR